MSKRGTLIAAVLFAIFFPTVVTWVYFVAQRDQSAAWQQATYSVGKLLQFSFPLIWVLGWQRKRIRGCRLADWRGLLIGIAFGGLVAGAMGFMYGFVLKPMGFFEVPTAAIQRKLTGLGLAVTWKYVLVGIFYALGHSFLEEYYWRWFVFRQVRCLTGFPWAVVISSLGFMCHHVLVLATYFGWMSPSTWLFSAAVAVGGAVWAVLYHYTRSLLVPWVGHCLVDAAIFAIGYDLAREVMT